MDTAETQKQFHLRKFKEKWCEEGGMYSGFLKQLCHFDDIVELVNNCVEADKFDKKQDDKICKHDYIYGIEGGYKKKHCRYCGKEQE